MCLSLRFYGISGAGRQDPIPMAQPQAALFESWSAACNFAAAVVAAVLASEGLRPTAPLSIWIAHTLPKSVAQWM